MERPEDRLDERAQARVPPQDPKGPVARHRQAIEALASEAVRRLARTAPIAARPGDVVVDEDLLEAFCRALVQPTPSAAHQFITERQAEGVTRDALYLGCICGAARRLGEAWDEDRLGFLDVTMGIGHLHHLMRRLRTEGPSGRIAVDARRSALFATVPGEDHSIGITVAADLFRDSGWDIELRLSTEHDGLVAHVDRVKPSIIGLSLSTERRFDDLCRLVAALRDVVPLSVIAVAPGAALDADAICMRVDIDFVFRDLQSAYVELERLIRLRGCPTDPQPPDLGGQAGDGPGRAGNGRARRARGCRHTGRAAGR